MFNSRIQGISIFKWQASCASTTATTPSISECVAATLVATLSRTGSSQSIILPMDASIRGNVDDDVLQLWVLNSNVCYASSEVGCSTQPTLAIKLLFKCISQKMADDILGRMTSNVQEINLPREAIRTVTDQLERSNGLLPVSEQQFKEWKIGLVSLWNPS